MVNIINKKGCPRQPFLFIIAFNLPVSIYTQQQVRVLYLQIVDAINNTGRSEDVKLTKDFLRGLPNNNTFLIVNMNGNNYYKL